MADANASGGYKACWLGQSEQNALAWNNVYAQKAGPRKLTIAYASGEDRQLTVSVNGQVVKTLTVNSGDFGRVGLVELPITLQKGDNVIRLANANAWMPDIDYINISE